MIIGKISRVHGIKAQAKLYNKMPPYIIDGNSVIQGPRINSYVKTNVGLDRVICKVVGEYVDTAGGRNSKRVLELSVIGSFVSNEFSPGLRCLPLIDANVELVSEEDYQKIFTSHEYSVKMGTNLFDSNNNLQLNVNSLVPSHIGIFGNTGSGKSNTLARLIHEYQKMIINNRISSYKSETILFDLNNEYGANAIINYKHKKIYRLSTRSSKGDRYPISYKSLTEDQIGVLLSATQKTQMPVVKVAMRNLKNKFSIEEREKAIKWAIVNGQRQVIYAIRNELREYVKGLDNLRFFSGKANAFVDDSRAKVDEFTKKRELHWINDIDDVSLDDIRIEEPVQFLERFKFEIIYAIVEYLRKGNNFEFVRPLIGRMNSRIKDFEKVFVDSEDSDSDFQFVIVQLAEVNRDIREIIPTMISGIIFDKLKSLDRTEGVESIKVIIIDEAHNLLYKSRENIDVASNNIDTFESIIKEGRKFGLFLWLASQRPSDISNTITSQVHHYFIHKLVNTNDINAIRKVVPYMDEESMNMISVMGPGECVVSGPGIDIPVFMKIDKLDDKNEPLSRNVKLFGVGGIFNKD
ncbi:ATP-binding protein [Mycoplasmatota bacterium zrk1]